jgi:hypothetical protein
LVAPQKQLISVGIDSYSAAESLAELPATSLIADMSLSVAVCWIMCPFPGSR